MTEKSRMEEWIVDDGGLDFLDGDYLCWHPTWEKITLDGDFTVEELRWIADYVDQNRENHNIPERTIT